MIVNKINLIILSIGLFSFGCMTIGFFDASLNQSENNLKENSNLKFQYEYKYIRKNGDGSIDLEKKADSNSIPYFEKNEELNKMLEEIALESNCKLKQEKTIKVSILEVYDKGPINIRKILSILSLSLYPLTGDYEFKVELHPEVEKGKNEIFQNEGKLRAYFSIIFQFGPSLIWPIKSEKKKAIKYLIANNLRNNINKICIIK